MRKTITIFLQEEDPFTLNKADILGGGDVLPGFSLSLSTLIAD
jgi:hypothetical protein